MIVMKVEPREPANFTVHKFDPKCPMEGCGSTNCKFYELRPRKLGGASEGYKCVKCSCRFTHRPGFLEKHYDYVAMSRAIDDVVKGKPISAAAMSIPKNSHPDIAHVKNTRNANRASST